MLYDPETMDKKPKGPGIPIGGMAGLGAGMLGSFLGGRQRSREDENSYNRNIAEDRWQNPNRRIQAGLQRNFRGNLLEQLALNKGMGWKGGSKSFWDALGIVDPELVGEFKNTKGVAGLRYDNKLVGPDPETFYKPKKPGLLESILGGVTKMFGQ